MKSKLICFIVGKTPVRSRGEAIPTPPLKSAPHYFEATVPKQFIIKQEKINIRGHEGLQSLKLYPPDALLVEITLDLPDLLNLNDVQAIKEEAIEKCREVLKKKGDKDVDEFSEEYSIYNMYDYSGSPDQFFTEKNQEKIASLLKSEKIQLDKSELDYTLASKVKYAKDDLVIIDWDGAFFFDPKGTEVEAVIEFFELANYQLLRYRLLNSDLASRFSKVLKLIQEPNTKIISRTNKEITQSYKEIIRVRGKSMAEFESLEREIRLIGEWYMARLYEITAKKFRFDEWRRLIKEKLDSLEDVYDIVSENFSVSRYHLLEIIQLGAFFILQIGWFALIILEFIYFTR